MKKIKTFKYTNNPKNCDPVLAAESRTKQPSNTKQNNHPPSSHESLRSFSKRFARRGRNDGRGTCRCRWSRSDCRSIIRGRTGAGVRNGNRGQRRKRNRLGGPRHRDGPRLSSWAKYSTNDRIKRGRIVSWVGIGRSICLLDSRVGPLS